MTAAAAVDEEQDGRQEAKPWQVVRDTDGKRTLYVREDGLRMGAGCHHRRSGGACAGCYARAMDALDIIERHPGRAVEVARLVGEAARAEAKPKRKRG